MKLSSRCLFWLTSALSLMAMAVALLNPNPAVAGDRVHPSSPDPTTTCTQAASDHG